MVICVGPTETEKKLAKAITLDCNFDRDNLVAKTSLKQWLAVSQQADLVWAPDSGPAHMTVTVQTQVIGLYSHSNPKRTGPYQYQDNVVSVYDSLLKMQSRKLTQDNRRGKVAKRLKG